MTKRPTIDELAEEYRQALAEERRRERIMLALEAAAAAAADALRARNAALAEIGELLRLAGAGQPGALVSMTEAEQVTGISRQSLIKYRDDRTLWDEIMQLAQLSRVYTEDDDGGARARLHAYYPQLAWLDYATYAAQGALEEDWTERHGFDVMSWGAPDSPAVDRLADLAASLVERLAEGRPTTLASD